MNKNKVISLILAAVGTVFVIGGLYFTISYLNTLGQGVIDFVSVNNVNTISRCGITVPEKFIEFRDNFATAILPALYLGFPIAVILISVIMFLSGYYFGKCRVEEELEKEVRKQKEIEEEVKKRVAAKKPKEKTEEEEFEEELKEGEEFEEGFRKLKKK
jgi:hypothetical protein